MFSVFHDIPRASLRLVVYSSSENSWLQLLNNCIFFSGRLLNNSLQVPLRRGHDKCMWNWWPLLTCCHSKNNKNIRKLWREFHPGTFSKFCMTGGIPCMHFSLLVFEHQGRPRVFPAWSLGLHDIIHSYPTFLSPCYICTCTLFVCYFSTLQSNVGQ